MSRNRKNLPFLSEQGKKVSFSVENKVKNKFCTYYKFFIGLKMLTVEGAIVTAQRTLINQYRGLSLNPVQFLGSLLKMNTQRIFTT